MQTPQCPAAWAVQTRHRIEGTDGKGGRPAGIGDVEDEGEPETPEEHRHISNAGVAETDSVHGVHGRPYGVNVKLLSAVLANTITPTRTPITALMIVHIFALLEDSIAPATSPAASLVLTWDA